MIATGSGIATGIVTAKPLVAAHLLEVGCSFSVLCRAQIQPFKPDRDRGSRSSGGSTRRRSRSHSRSPSDRSSKSKRRSKSRSPPRAQPPSQHASNAAAWSEQSLYVPTSYTAYPPIPQQPPMQQLGMAEQAQLLQLVYVPSPSSCFLFLCVTLTHAPHKGNKTRHSWARCSRLFNNSKHPLVCP